MDDASLCCVKQKSSFAHHRTMQLAIRSIETRVWVPWAKRVRIGQSGVVRVGRLRMSQNAVLQRIEGSSRYRHVDIFDATVALRALRCDGLARILGTSESAGEVFLVVAAVSGLPLMQYLERFPSTRRRPITALLSDALLYLHDRGIVHGDIRADNVVVRPNGNPVLTGLSVRLDSQEAGARPPLWAFAVNDPTEVDPDVPDLKPDDANFKDWAYLLDKKDAPAEPEQQLIEDARASLLSTTPSEDVFAFGILLVEIYTQVAACSSLIALQLLRMAFKRQRPPHPGPAAELRGLDSDTWRLCLRCWRIGVERQCTMGDVVKELHRERDDIIISPFSWSLSDLEKWYTAHVPRLEERMSAIEYLGRSRDIGQKMKENRASLNSDSSKVEVMAIFHEGMRRFDTRNKIDCYAEIFVWSQFRHPNVLELMGTAHYRSSITFVLPPMHGGTCTDYLKANPSADRMSISLQVAEGLNYLHTRSPRIAHGAVQAYSVVFGLDRVAKLWNFDFGPVIHPGRGFDDSFFIGPDKLQWLSPEHMWSRNFSGGCEGDVWSFGMFVLEIFTGTPPREDCPPVQLLTATFDGQRPQRPLIPSIGDELWDLLCACWHRQPGGRPKLNEVLGWLQLIRKGQVQDLQL